MNSMNIIRRRCPGLRLPISEAVEFNKNTLISSKVLTVEIKSFLNYLCGSCERFMELSIIGSDSFFRMAVFIGILLMSLIIQWIGVKITLKFLLYESQFRF